MLDDMIQREWCSRSGAEALKKQIEDYWAERGHVVEITLRPADYLSAFRSSRVDVRSNLVNGKPVSC